ncbi:MAG: hypothetical protein AAF805_00580 [Planctomycetota bacterium]
MAAIALMSATLVPAMQLVRRGMEVGEETDRRSLLAAYGVSQLEQQEAAVATSWSTGTLSGDYAADGHPDIRFDTVTSDDPLSGGVIDVLMDLRTTVYYDANGNNALDSDELRTEYRTKVGRFATYEAMAP